MTGFLQEMARQKERGETYKETWYTHQANELCESCLDPDADKPTVKQTCMRIEKIQTLTRYLITLILLFILCILIVLCLYF